MWLAFLWLFATSFSTKVVINSLREKDKHTLTKETKGKLVVFCICLLLAPVTLGLCVALLWLKK